ncbi:Hsp70 family protein, partial [Myxococcota bacterium]|nr:Hsp70 family protein [Myxococcota bacterium]
RDADAFAQETIGSAVLTVPAQFGDAERRATKLAALLAGVPNPYLLEEPIAAATYYGVAEARRDSTLFVYDLGGGTFDATLLRTSPDGLDVLATDGSARVGGKAFDDAIMAMVAEDFRRAHGFDPLGDPVARVQLRRFAEDAKIRLGRAGKGQVRQAILLAGRTYDFFLTRTQFERLIAPLVDESIEAAQRCLQSAGLDWPKVDQVLLAGGSTLVPYVQQRVREAADKPGDRMVAQQPHQAVAFGAALVAAQRAGEIGGARLRQQVTSYELGMRVWDRKQNRPGVQPLIPRNTPLPARHAAIFYTTRPDQTRMILELTQTRGEGAEPMSLGHFAFGPIASPRKNYPVEVTVAYDGEGLVRVAARDPNTGSAMERMLDASEGGASLERKGQRDLVTSVRINE